MFLFDGLAHAGQCLHTITGVEAGGVDLMLEPGTAWESVGQRESALDLYELLVYRLQAGLVERGFLRGLVVAFGAACEGGPSVFERGGTGSTGGGTDRGITDRTRVIFGPPGHACVYFIYGMYECLNLVAEPDRKPGCVLIRALEPVAGIETMRRRRPAAHTLRDLASGPGRLTLALGITRAQNGVDVTRGGLTVRTPRREQAFEIAVTPRLGIRKCADWPLRFVVKGEFVRQRVRG